MATTATSTSTSSGSSGSDTLTASSGGSKISAGAGDDTILGGAGNDTLNGDAGNDTLVYNISQNVGTQDTYTGGSGIDTLLIQFTTVQWLLAGYQAQIAAYLAHLVAYTNRVTSEVSNGIASDFTFQFGTSTLKVQMVEKLAVTVDGTSVDPADAACVAVADSVTTSEDGGPIAVNVLANDIVPDLVKDLALGTGPSHGTAALMKPNASDPSTWYFQYQANNAYFQSLAVGETATDNFTYSVTDADGDVSTSTVTVTITGSNDGPVIGVADLSGSVTEDSAAITLHDSGTISFDDVDLSDAHTTSVQAVAGNLLGGSLTAVVTTAATGAGAGTVTWDYNVANSATQYLAAGETVVEQFVVKVSDGHGGTAMQTVSVTVTGTNDAPTVSSAVATGSLVEDAALPTLATSGTITFDDVDLTDTHTTTVSADSGNKLGGSLTAAITDVATGAGDGTVKWDYSVSNSATQYLAAGEMTTESFTVKVKDNHGGFVDQGVTVTVTGVNDGPTFSNADSAGSVTEDASTPNLTDTGAITFDDGRRLRQQAGRQPERIGDRHGNRRRRRHRHLELQRCELRHSIPCRGRNDDRGLHGQGKRQPWRVRGPGRQSDRDWRQ
ncbi:MAG: VCBS domain-containing protein [Pseudomonadota bacterium]